jgi:hypothetical protein
VPSALLTPETGAHKRTLDIRNLVPSALLTPETGAHKGRLDIRNFVPSALLTPKMGAYKRTLDIRNFVPSALLTPETGAYKKTRIWGLGVRGNGIPVVKLLLVSVDDSTNDKTERRLGICSNCLLVLLVT